MSDSVPRLEELDRQLTFWEQQIARVKTNLDLLQQTPSFEFIASGLKLTGRTQSEVVVPILDARDLADQYEQLAGQVAKARLLRNSVGRFRQSPKTLDEIDRLLNGPCIPLPAAQVPLAQRNLLDDPIAQSHLSLQQLVGVMTEALASARDAVIRYDQAMANLKPALDTADQQLSALSARASSLSGLAVAALNSLRTVAQNARREALDDPLSVEADFSSSLKSRIESVSRQLDAMEQERAAVHDDLARAQARQAHASRVRAMDPTTLLDLGNWLASIGKTAANGQYAAARIGLQRWNTAADKPYSTEERRQEQLDLLKALRAMAQKRRERGVVISPDLDALAIEAESALRTTPADLSRAAELVQRYQRGVTSL
jgi:prefoldin subunit 5